MPLPPALRRLTRRAALLQRRQRRLAAGSSWTSRGRPSAMALCRTKVQPDVIPAKIRGHSFAGPADCFSLCLTLGFDLRFDLEQK